MNPDTYAYEQKAKEWQAQVAQLWPARNILVLQLYFWDGFDNASFVMEKCAELRLAYDAALFWGTPTSRLAGQLNACFGPGEQLPDMMIWKRQ